VAKLPRTHEGLFSYSYESSKTTESPLSKTEAKSPDVSIPVKYKFEKQNEALTYPKNQDNTETPVKYEPMETEAKKVTPAVTEPANKATAPSVAAPKKTEGGRILKPRGRPATSTDIEPAVVVIPEQNMKESKKAPVKAADNQSTQSRSSPSPTMRPPTNIVNT
jgi:hypothetical protein